MIDPEIDDGDSRKVKYYAKYAQRNDCWVVFVECHRKEIAGTGVYFLDTENDLAEIEAASYADSFNRVWVLVDQLKDHITETHSR